MKFIARCGTVSLLSTVYCLPLGPEAYEIVSFFYICIHQEPPYKEFVCAKKRSQLSEFAFLKLHVLKLMNDHGATTRKHD